DLTQWLTDYIGAGGWPESDQQHVPISELFPPRGIFGLYAQQRLAEAKALSASTVAHVRGEVVDLQVDEASTLLTLDNGQQLRGAFAVLATG
ncbi:FAD/NAD(P)-binding protein, partial [Klebsiella pneumoniae]